MIDRTTSLTTLLLALPALLVTTTVASAQSGTIEPGPSLPPITERAPADEQQGSEQAKPEVKGSEANATDANDPVAQLIRQSNLKTRLGRRQLRDNLYAMLATAPNKKSAARIAARIERLWLQYGSDTVTLLLSRAAKANKAKNHELALKFLDAALELAPDFAEAWNRRALVHFEAGDLRLAVGDLRRVLALDPNHFQALSGLARIMSANDRDADALKAYERLLDVHPFMDGAEAAYEKLKEEVEGRGI